MHLRLSSKQCHIIIIHMKGNWKHSRLLLDKYIHRFAFVTTHCLYIHMYIANGFSLRILIVYRHICFIGSREGSLYFGVAFFSETVHYVSDKSQGKPQIYFFISNSNVYYTIASSNTWRSSIIADTKVIVINTDRSVKAFPLNLYLYIQLACTLIIVFI